MKKYIKVSLVGGGTYVLPLDEFHHVLDEIEEADFGEVWYIEKIKMTQAYYDDLPEFTGH